MNYKDVEIFGGGGVVVVVETVFEISGGPPQGDSAGEHRPECQQQYGGEGPEFVASAAEDA